MKRIRYHSATELLEKARQKMVPLPNQWAAQKRIASLIAMHLSKLQALDKGADPGELVSCSAFLVGPTGNGKTYIIKCLAEACGLHFAAIDCTSITQAGVRGKNLGDNLAAIKSENPAFFEGGILLLDEADKAFYKGDPHYDAYSPMQEFLKLMEGGEYSFRSDGISGTVNLDKTLILLAGACANIVHILKRRYNPRPVIGFSSQSPGSEIDIENYGPYVTLDDLIAYGMMPELASRINTVIAIPKIDEAGYQRLLIDTAKTSALNRFRNQFAMRGVALDIAPEAVQRIAELCVERNVGARSINAILFEKLSEAYSAVDDTPTHGRVILQTDELGELQTVYQEGERLSFPMFTERACFDGDFSIKDKLRDEDSINRLCDDICAKASLEDVSAEPLLYYFLQTACRYMAEEVRPEDRSMVNLCRLAGATEKPDSSKAGKSPFDIVCEDYLLKIISKAEDSLKHQEEEAPLSRVSKNRMWATSKDHFKYAIFNHYYSAFCRTERQHADVPKVLAEAIDTARKHYISNKKEKSSTI
ncbi:MAG: AAA family ATPase [Ruminococcaceae bacterium]|nr:AAA family ATPase [Oscillospiraceae bacterium]